MNLAQHPAGDNLHYLEQGLALIDRLADDAWTVEAGPRFRGGVGSQLRHCLDFYDCFLRGLGSGRIDYSDRRRDPRIESERGYAAGRLRELIDRLRGLAGLDLGRAVEVRSDEPTSAGSLDAWASSSVRRELQFLISHTIHHYALIVALLARQGIVLDDDLADFGIAPSTLRSWKASDSLVR